MDSIIQDEVTTRRCLWSSLARPHSCGRLAPSPVPATRDVPARDRQSLISTHVCTPHTSVGTSPDAAGKSACATLGICLALGVLFFCGTVLAADETPLASLAKLAADLSENDSDGALDYFDSQMKGYAEIERNIEALTAQADISCSIDIVTDVESNGVHKLDLDWYLQLKSQSDEAQLERRRERVQVQMRLMKGVWKITSLAPLSILEPLHVR